MRIALALALVSITAAVAGCAREPVQSDPVIVPQPAPVTVEPVYTGKL